MAIEMENDKASSIGSTFERRSETTDAGGPASSARIHSIIRWISVILILGSILMIFRSLPFDQAMSAMKTWIAGLGFWGPVVLTLMYIVATVLFVPGTILTLVAGAIFGLGVGTVIVSIGSTIGASLAFLIARYAARDRVAKLAARNRHFGAIDRAIGEGGWKIVGLLRLSPALPFNLQNYLYGLTPVAFGPYVLTSWVAMLPGTFLYVYLGHVTGAAIGADRERSTAEWAMLAVGLLATVVVTVYVTRMANSKLKEQVSDETGTESFASDATRDGSSGEASLEPSEPRPNGNNASNSSGQTRTVLFVSIAIVMLAVATYVRAHAETIEKSLSRWFGPPRVEMTEEYSAVTSGPTVDHSQLNTLLQTYVNDDGWVDYEGLQKDEAKLDEYLEQIARAPFADLGRNEKLALLINAYNASTLKLVIENLPIESNRDIPESQRWDAVRWKVGGQTWSLNQIEHEQIRPNFAEPRIHFALVCAAIGCPPLRNTAYQGERIDEQLQQQTEYVHRHATWFEFERDEPRLRLTRLYDWYRGDFEQAEGSVTNFAAKYSSELREAMEAEQSPTLDWLPYDWRLNGLNNQQPR